MAAVAAAPWGPLHGRLHRLLLRRPELLPRGSRLLLAVSGGQDSLCLLQLLLELRRLHGWGELVVFHADHRWQPDSGERARRLGEHIRGLGLPFVLSTAAPSPRSEAAARDWRYEEAGRQALHHHCCQVVTGHTATDRAETMLFQLSRGCGPRGLASLRPRRSLAPGLGLVRPLLDVTREQTGRFCADRQLPVLTDPSNDDLRFSRNRIRQRVLKELLIINPRAVEHLAASAADLEADANLLDGLAAAALARIGTSTGGLSRQGLGTLAPALASRCLIRWLAQQGVESIERRQLQTLQQLVAEAGNPGCLDLKDGYRCCVERQTLRVERLPH